MNKRAREALLESIEKWRQIEAGEMPDMGRENCSLCMEFVDDGCRGCPVSEATGLDVCMNTPYEDWMYENEEELGRYFMSLVADTPKLVRLAREERKFLESLL